LKDPVFKTEVSLELQKTVHAERECEDSKPENRKDAHFFVSYKFFLFFMSNFMYYVDRFCRSLLKHIYTETC